MAMAERGWMITGTDTGVGKTFVACGIAGALRRRGLSVAPFKPAETGCEFDERSRGLIPADAEMLRQATGTQATLDTICPYRFQPPVAPWVAAEQAGVAIDPSRLEQCYRELAASHDFVLVETAGGILVPLAENFHYADLARRLRLPVLVVAASKLGVLNHTLLTLSFLKAAGIPVLAVALNHPFGETDAAIETNERTLRRLAEPSLFRITHQPGAPPGEQKGLDELAQHVAAQLSAMK